MATGLGSAFSISPAEGTYATPETPTRRLTFIDESLGLGIEPIESPGLSGSLMPAAGSWRLGNRQGSGSTRIVGADRGLGLFLDAALGGSVNVSAVSPYEWRFYPAALSSHTIQVGIGGDTSVTRKQYAGAVCESWSIDLAVGDNLEIAADWITADEAIATGQNVDGTAVADSQVFSFVDGALTVAGSSIPCPQSISFTGDNSLEARRCIGSSTLTKVPDRTDFVKVTGSFRYDFDPTDLTAYNAWKAGTEAALVLVLTAPSGHLMTITANIRYDGTSPNIDGPGVVETDVPFKCVIPASIPVLSPVLTADAAAFRILVETTTDSTL